MLPQLPVSRPSVRLTVRNGCRPIVDKRWVIEENFLYGEFGVDLG